MRPSFAFALLVVVTGVAHAQDRPDRALVSYVDSVANAAVADHRTPGLAVAIVKRGKIVVAKGYGYADLENDVPATAETVFRIGSITKQFTAAGIMRLEEQGKLSLDDTLQKFLPNYPTQGNRVTIRHLLNHTSGIKNYTTLGPKWQRVMRLDMVPDSLAALFAAEPFDFKPGDRWLYDNSGYFLLGMVIEKISGKAYGQYLQDELFTPLGLKNTLYCDQARLIKHRAQGYANKPNGQFGNAEPLSMTLPYAAGSLCSTVGDLAMWTAALAGGKVVSLASYKQMTTPVALNNGQPLTYGFGLRLSTLRGHGQIGHNGGINGFISELHHYVDDSVVTVVLTNVGNTTATQIEKLIATRALGIPDTAAVPLSATELARYEGTYQLPRLRVKMFAENGRRSSQGEGQGVIHLKHLGGGRFVAEDNDDIRIEFPAAGAPAPNVVIRQAGTATTAPRVP